MKFAEYVIESFKKPVTALADRPIMSARELKEWFDSNSTDELKTSVNSIASLLDSKEGAANVGCSDYKSMGANVEKFICNLADRAISTQSELIAVRDMINQVTEAAKSAQYAAQEAMRYAERANEIANEMNWLVLIDPESGKEMGIQEILYNLYYHMYAKSEITCDIWDKADWQCSMFDARDFTCTQFDTDNIFSTQE